MTSMVFIKKLALKNWPLVDPSQKHSWTRYNSLWQHLTPPKTGPEKLSRPSAKFNRYSVTAFKLTKNWPQKTLYLHQAICGFLIVPLTLQKGSPYLDEVNQLLHLANQMGLIEGLIEQTLENRTKCSTWSDIYEAHMDKRDHVVLHFDDIYGLMILLSIGLSLAFTSFLGEKMIHWSLRKKMERNI